MTWVSFQLNNKSSISPWSKSVTKNCTVSKYTLKIVQFQLRNSENFCLSTMNTPGGLNGSRYEFPCSRDHWYLTSFCCMIGLWACTRHLENGLTNDETWKNNNWMQTKHFVAVSNKNKTFNKLSVSGLIWHEMYSNPLLSTTDTKQSRGEVITAEWNEKGKG